MNRVRLLLVMSVALVGFDLPTPGVSLDEAVAPVPASTPTAAASTVGSVFPASPPRLALPDPAPSVEAIRRAMQAADTARALRLAYAYVEEHPWGRTRDAAWLLIGMLEREAGHYNDASAAFTRVRAADGPLAQFGAYYEAEQDLVRGKYWVAIRECERVRETWPDGPHDAECLRVMALGHARLGNRRNALDVASEYDEAHPVGPITEQVELELAKGWMEEEPERATAALTQLAVTHEAPLTGRVAEMLLNDLVEMGQEDAALPTDTESLKARAVSLRDAGRSDDAWAVWEELVQRSQDDPSLQRWLDAQVTSFAWRLRNFDVLTAEYEARYAEDPSADLAWRLHRAYSRAGNFEKAMEWVSKGRESHANQGPWRRSEDVQAQAYLLGGDYETAAELLDVAAQGRGWNARRAQFRSAFARYMGGHHEDAIERLSGVIEDGRTNTDAAHYWRARAYEALDEHERAEADIDWLADNDGNGWYGQLARPDADRPTTPPFARNGQWPGAALPQFEAAPTPVYAATPAPTASMATLPRMQQRSANPGFASISWRVLPPPPRVPTDRIIADLKPDLTRPPESYGTAAFHDPGEAEAFALSFADAHGGAFPMLQAAVDMARVGLYDLSGPLMATVYDDIGEARRRRGHPGHTATRRITTDHSDWRKVFLFTRDHHHAARFTYGMHEELDGAVERDRAQRLTYPLAYDRFVWDRARDNDIDPFLVLSLMRQESVYDPNALSRVGARGAMQIMPKTGHRIADLTGNLEYTAADLEDPIASIGFGVTYLARLMERFDDVYPLAIASYNGGPHNVSAWLAGTTSDMPMDAFVEHIPFRETRGYVQSVSSHYATYLSLYAPDGTELSIPAHPAGDHPEVVDF